MTSSVKRLCSNSSSSLTKFQWNPIVHDEYIKLPELKSMIVGRVKNPRVTSDILSFLNQIYPWPNDLKHIRRLYQLNQQVDIILYPNHFPNPIEKEKFNEFFEKETRIVDIPLTPCLLKWQYQQLIKICWPNIVYKQNPILEKTLLKKNLTEFDEIILDLFKKMEEDYGENHYSIIVNNQGNIPLVACKDSRAEHPLQHSVMLAIDYLSSNSIYKRENLLFKYIQTTKSKESYLLNGCSIYLTDEPCVMCAMALLHSRIENVFYINSNQTFGSLGSIYKLHILKQTNHRFNVYQLKQSENT